MGYLVQRYISAEEDLGLQLGLAGFFEYEDLDHDNGMVMWWQDGHF